MHPIIAIAIAMAVLLAIGVSYSIPGSVTIYDTNITVRWADLQAVAIVVGLILLCKAFVQEIRTVIKRR